MLEVCCHAMLLAIEADTIIVAIEGDSLSKKDGIYIVSFSKDGTYEQISYCPFCGKDIK